MTAFRHHKAVYGDETPHNAYIRTIVAFIHHFDSDDLTVSETQLNYIMNNAKDMKILSNYIDEAYSVLLLTVNPGFSNQGKAVNLIDRVQEFKDLYPNYSNLLIVDGGVKKDELESLRNLDVDIAVQGGAIFAK